MIPTIFAAGAGLIIFLFLFWKRLKEDYSSEIIFKSAFNIIIGIALGWLISFKLIPGAFLWLSFAGALLGLGFATHRQNVRFYESLEALTLAALPWVSFIFLKDSVIYSTPSSFFAFLATLVFIFIYYYFDQHYKNFTWYKSGKIGFSGLATLGIVFLVRSAIAISGIPMISFLSGYEAVGSALAAFICFGLIFNLGRKTK